MRTKKKVESLFSVDIKLPRSWSELTDEQLKYYFKLKTMGYNNERFLTNCFRRWANITRIKQLTNAWNIKIKLQDEYHNIKLEQYQLDYCVMSLSWLLEDSPGEIIRVGKIGNATAVHKSFEGVPFKSYLIAENYYQGYLATGLDSCLQGLARELYTGEPLKLEPWSALAVVTWWYSFKLHLTNKYSHLFQSVESNNPDEVDYEAAMNAQIRALTGGDVTKDALVKSLDTNIALTELNEKAKEAKELRKQLKR